MGGNVSLINGHIDEEEIFMKQRIRLDTITNIQKFVEVVSHIPYKVTLEDGRGFCVSAKSLLGGLATIEWDEVYCCCENDIAGKILPWII